MSLATLNVIFRNQGSYNTGNHAYSNVFVVQAHREAVWYKGPIFHSCGTRAYQRACSLRAERSDSQLFY